MSVFVSYSWDSEPHKAWVRSLVDDLRRNGVEAILDQYQLDLGDDRIRFMERSVRTANCVLCVCTPSYVERANQRKGGAGTETSLISPKVFDESEDTDFIPVIRASDDDIPLVPDYMDHLIYVDFRDDGEYEEKLEKLLRHIHEEPEHEEPSIGKKPSFDKSGEDSQGGPSIYEEESKIDKILDKIINSVKDDWKFYDEDGIYVFKSNPDIVIKRESIDHDLDQFKEEWAQKFPDPSAYRSVHVVEYNGNPIHKEFLVSVDGHRMYLPLPDSANNLQISHEKYLFGRLINSFNPWGDRYDQYLDTADISVEEQS